MPAVMRYLIKLGTLDTAKPARRGIKILIFASLAKSNHKMKGWLKMDYLLSVLPLLSLICGVNLGLVIVLVLVVTGGMDKIIEWIEKHTG